MGSFLLRTAVIGLALWVVTLIVPGIEFVGGDTSLQRVGIVLVVAAIFGLVNAIIKPIVQILSIPLYILTLGLFHVVINALMLWITAWMISIAPLPTKTRSSGMPRWPASSAPMTWFCDG